MGDWDEFGDGSDFSDTTGFLDCFDESSFETAESMDTSSTMDAVEPLESDIDFLESSLDMDDTSSVDSVMDSVEVAPIEFDESYDLVEPALDEDAIEFDDTATTDFDDSIIQNQILDIPEAAETEPETPQEIVDEVLEERLEVPDRIDEMVESGDLSIEEADTWPEVTQEIEEVLEARPKVPDWIEVAVESGDLPIEEAAPEPEVTQEIEEVLEARPEAPDQIEEVVPEPEVTQDIADEVLEEHSELSDGIDGMVESGDLSITGEIGDEIDPEDHVEAIAVDFGDEVYEQVGESDIGVGENIEENLDLEEILSPREALDNMSDYMNSHNYGLEDYETYSQDPEWQALNRDLQIANGTDVTEIADAATNMEGIEEPIDPYEALDNMSQYMNEHNYGLEDYAEYSQDPEWQALNRDLQAANGMELSEISESAFEQNAETIEPRVFDEFEQSVLEKKPEFYETGQFYEQGINEFGYEGTCGPTSQANAINELLGTTDLTENKVLSVAIDNQLCNTFGTPEECGGTSTEQFMELYDKMNELLGDRFNTELYEYDNVLDASQVAARLEAGDVINVAVDANALWNQPRNYVDAMGVRHDDFYSDHWITVAGVQRATDGSIDGFHIIDSGGGENYVSLDKYNEMCFGTSLHRVIDPTCIVLSKKV